ncbi:opioid-binding protein/cell adhesion molecule-like [Macrobrachium rosenbergii]|uniref:opioid-binding protein/cell adhesion molecule-like n=1 Tax=Macrobrachium rosenbergii TaxID=79674 RepID=UPI0034D3A795
MTKYSYYCGWIRMLLQLSCLAMVVSSPSNTSQPTESATQKEEVTDPDPFWEIRHVLPELDLENNTVTEVRINAGEIALLPCRFPQLSTLHQAFLLLQVSWIRRWDWHILTTGIYTYTSDARFKVLHTEGSDDWTLQIKYVATKDNGTYECQMYTGTGVLSQFVNLHVETPTAVISGPGERHVQEGDTLTLICHINQTQPSFVFWYHNSVMVNYDTGRESLKVTTEEKEVTTSSRLTITDARQWDSGNYTCVPPNVHPASVIVFVTEGDTVAAVQRRGHNGSGSSSSSSSSRERKEHHRHQ